MNKIAKACSSLCIRKAGYEVMLLLMAFIDNGVPDHDITNFQICM
jgi:hypothetical protein